ncbi:MAG: NAD(+) synthase [Bacillota bacterium]|nr:NAD(+) synthase [Bacillota bacterium]
MSFGFTRVAAAVPEVKVAECGFNREQIEKLIKMAAESNVQVIVFPELSLTGYTCGDLFLQEMLVKSAEDELGKLLNFTCNLPILSVIGMPVRANNQLFNCAVAIQSGRILAAVPKTYIPNYSEYYEKRWFASSLNAVSGSVTLCNQEIPFGADILLKSGELCIGMEICEDLWVPIPPSCYQSMAGANVILNLSASNEIIGKCDYRKSLVAQQSGRCVAGYIYSSAGVGESTTDVVFAGHAIISENGAILAESERFERAEQLIITEIDLSRLAADRRKNTSFMGNENIKSFRVQTFDLIDVNDLALHRKTDQNPFVPASEVDRGRRSGEIFAIQAEGLAKRLSHTRLSNVVLGISGGLDSTLALLVCTKTFDLLNLDRKGIIAVTMPGFGTTGRTYNNALSLMQSLGVSIREIDIKPSCIQHFKDIGHDETLHDITYENTQARERTQILMDIANQVNGLVIGTGDLSELALGWATYNGDHMSMYGVNSGVPKTLVRYLVKWVSENVSNPKTAEILNDILLTPVSPELLPSDENGEIAQKTEDTVGPYELHDFFLYYMVRFGFEPAKIFFLAQNAYKDKYDNEIILKWLKVFYRRFFSQQFKRSCLPDGPKVGTINLSPRGDWRMPSDASFKIWMDELNLLTF